MHNMINIINIGDGGRLVAKSCDLAQVTLVMSWSVALQVPLSMEFSRQEFWSGLPFPSPIINVPVRYM